MNEKLRPYERLGYIISTSVKTTLLEYIEKRKNKKYVLETHDMKSWTNYILFDYEEYEGLDK